MGKKERETEWHRLMGEGVIGGRRRREGFGGCSTHPSENSYRKGDFGVKGVLRHATSPLLCHHLAQFLLQVASATKC